MTKNPFQLANVMLSEELRGTDEGINNIHTSLLAGVVFDAAYDKPTWKFVAIRLLGGKIAGFSVTEGGEQLGTISTSYFRRGYCVEIKNTRISNKRERGGGYRTTDAGKALAAIKKAFSRKNISEHIEESNKLISKTLNDISWGKGRAHHKIVNEVQEELLEFSRKDAETQKLFLEHLNRIGKGGLKGRQEEAFTEMQTVERILRQYDAGEATVVLLVDSKYVVKESDNVMMFDATDLPENLRGKLGLLKLVDDGYVITDVGCKVNSETFVLFNAKGDEV